MVVVNQSFFCAFSGRFGLILCTVLLCFGCARTPRAQFADAGSLLERLEDSTSCSRALRAEAKLSFSGDGRRLAGKVLYQVQAPNRVRFDIFSPFGVTLSTLASDGRIFSLYSIEEKAFLYGPSKSCNVQRFTQVPVPTEAFVEILRGRAPVLIHEEFQSQLEYRTPFLEGGYYEITIASVHGAQEKIQLAIPPEQYSWPIEQQRPRLLGVSVSQNQRELYRVDLSDYSVPEVASAVGASTNEAEGGAALGFLLESVQPSGPVCDAELPGSIRIYVPSSGYSLALDNVELIHNPTLANSAFVQPQPPGIAPMFADCQD